MKKIMALLLLLPCIAHAESWELVGKGEMHKLFWHVYDSALYSKDGTYNPNKPYALENTYRMDFTDTELADRTIEEMRSAHNISDAQAKLWRHLLVELWPNVKEGDVIRAKAIPKTSVQFFLNGKKLGVIADAQFVQPFMDIWLGEKSSEPELRNALIGKKS